LKARLFAPSCLIARRPRFLAIALLLPALAALPCTSFVLKTEDHLLFGANFDNDIRWGLVYANPRGIEKHGWEPGSTGKNIVWASKYGSVTVTSVGYQLPWAGMNEAGLVLSTMAVEDTRAPDPDPRPALASPYWMQYLLDTCGSLEEVLASEKHVRISDCVDHYLVCDAKGNAAVIEFFDGRMNVHKGRELPVTALANEAYATCIEKMKHLGSPGVRRTHSAARLERLEEMTDAFDPKTQAAVSHAFRMLEAVSNSATVWSLVFDIPNRTLLFRTDKNRAIRSIKLNKLDFTAHTLSPMMDVHADWSGDITDKFRPFDAKLSLRHLLRALEAYEKEIPEAKVREIFEMMQGFRRRSGGGAKGKR